MNRTKTLTLDEEQFNIVKNSVGIHLSNVKTLYPDGFSSDSFLNKIQEVYSILTLIPFNEDINL